MRRLLVVLSLVAGFRAHAAQNLTIVQAGPVGEVAQLSEANEIRVVFSEPMVAVGKIPKTAPAWFHVTPAIRGAFRWSGTTTLIFGRDLKTPLPYATRYDVTIDADAKALSGKTLGKPYTFSFVTPTIRLLRTDWYRKGNTATGAAVIGLWFNQPVDRDTVLQHLQLRSEPHDLELPDLQPEARARMTQPEIAAFETKVRAVRAAAASNGTPVQAFLADDWNKERWKPAPELVVLETKPGIAQDLNLQVYLDAELARSPANVRTGREQTFTIELDPAFFVTGMNCTKECDPEERNAIEFRGGNGVKLATLQKALHVTDITDRVHEVPLEPAKVSADVYDEGSSYSLDDLGYTIVPAHTYAIRIDPSLKAIDGQTLGYPFTAVVDYWHKSAFTSFGGGHGVWEASGGTTLPFFARNYRTVTEWAAPLTVNQLMPSIVTLQEHEFSEPPPGPGHPRTLAPAADKIQSYGMNIAPVVGADGRGLLWAAVEPGETIPKAKAWGAEPKRRATIVQVTNLGISVKDSPQNTLIFVTRLDDGQPVAGANVSIRTLDNSVFWSGTTDAHGLATAPDTHLRVGAKPGNEEDEWQALSKLHFIVVAEKGGDVAYAASNWNEGITPWEFDVPFDLSERTGLLRGTVFTDRGVYKLGEEVHVKAVVRSDTPRGMQLLAPGTKLDVTITDSHDKEVEKRTVALNEWSSAEFTWSVPSDGPLGTYTIHASSPGARLTIDGEFLVTAYRRPDFRVDVTLHGANSIAGTPLDGTITGRYLFGAPMAKRPVRRSYTKTRLFDVPETITDRWPDATWTFLGCVHDCESPRIDVESKEQKLDAKGELHLQLLTQLDAGVPYAYTLEGEVTDVSRQKIANRATFRVDPAPWYVGLRTVPYFAEAATGVDTELIAAGFDGAAVAGVNITVTLKRVQWNSVRHAEGHGFYTWESERKEVDAGSWTVTTKSTPVPLHVPLGEGGEYYLYAEAKDAEGRSTTTMQEFYAGGSGYTAWERYDHNRIDLVPEKQTWKPGDTARIMIKSPWERATALLTTEREGVRTSRQFELTSTQQTVTVPITADDIPNVYVSVLLIKGRTKDATPDDASDPGKPSFRIGYTDLRVVDASKRLRVAVKANRDEYRPATKARIDVDVRDADGKPARSEVTLWAVDYGVLSLTGYQTPDVLTSIYLHKALQVVNEDSRQMIISRRALTPKGAADGGGGGRDAGPGMLRKDFRVLAFWVGSIVTDKNGHAKTEITLPDSLTTYRIMAVAADQASRFGKGDSEIRISKPVLLSQAFPRFMAVGDKAYFGGVVHSQLARAGRATVTIRSLDPSVIEFASPSQTVDVPEHGTVEVRFDANAKAVGTARVQMSVSLNGENDAFEDVIPVRVLASPETFAAYGETTSAATETLHVPEGLLPNFGGVHVETSSTALTGLSEGAEYLVTYPYGCAEQRGSAAFALMLASDLGDAFKLDGIDAAKARTTAQSTLVELEKFQCGDGGFAFWAGDCESESPYLTSYLVHVFQRGQSLKYGVNAKMLDRAYSYLEAQLKTKRPANEGWWPAYAAWQAFTVKALVEGGRNEDSHITRLLTYSDRMPVFALAYLADALIAKRESGPRLDDLLRRINNAILPEGGSAHVEELADPYLLYYWNSNIRSTAIVLNTLTRAPAGAGPRPASLVRWLMSVRKDGRWRNTQENAWAMEALVDYYRRFEAEVPDFAGVVTMGRETIARDEFRGRSSVAKVHDRPVPPPAESLPVTFTREGSAGTLFYLLRLRYALAAPVKEPLSMGFEVERRYTSQDGKPVTSFKAGELIKVTLKVRNTKERRFVAVTDPIPAGTEPVESWFATTATDLAEAQRRNDTQSDDWSEWWRRGGFDHVERHDDRVDLFATRLAEGPHEFTYMLRATTSGTFLTAPAHAEEMYEPEVFGRTASAVVEVGR